MGNISQNVLFLYEFMSALDDYTFVVGIDLYAEYIVHRLVGVKSVIGIVLHTFDCIGESIAVLVHNSLPARGIPYVAGVLGEIDVLRLTNVGAYIKDDVEVFVFYFLAHCPRVG